MLTPDPVVAWKKQHLREVGLAIERHPLHSKADVILCPNHFDVSFYQGTLPVVFWTDATYANMLSMYPNYRCHSERLQSFEHHIERKAVDKAIGAMWASEFAMNSAIAEYGADPHRQLVTRFGLNLPKTIDAAELDAIVRRPRPEVIRLMFIGFDYKRKGLDIALQAVV